MVKKYLGSPITAFAAIIMPLIVCLPLCLGIIAFSSQINSVSICLFFSGIPCTIVLALWQKEIAIQLYAWGVFLSDGVRIKTFFSKGFLLQYTRCFGCGIGYYTHGILNSEIGTKIYFIFLSYDKFDERYRTRINLWKPTKTQIKVKFTKDLYDFLITVLPKAQLQMLIQDYKKYKTEDGLL